MMRTLGLAVFLSVASGQSTGYATFDAIMARDEFRANKLHWVVFKIVKNWTEVDQKANVFEHDIVVDPEAKVREENEIFDNFIKAIKASGEPRYGLLSLKERVYFVSCILPGHKMFLTTRYRHDLITFRDQISIHGHDFNIAAVHEDQL